jgi:hypothetical protein
MKDNSELKPHSTLPARLAAEGTARLLGFALHDIPVLVACGLLRPLGKPAPNGPKFFATCDLIDLTQDTQWLNRASKAVCDHWKEKNSKKTKVQK